MNDKVKSIYEDSKNPKAWAPVWLENTATDTTTENQSTELWGSCNKRHKTFQECHQYVRQKTDQWRQM